MFLKSSTFEKFFIKKMIRYPPFYFFLVFFAMQSIAQNKTDVNLNFEEYTITNSSIRAIEVVNDSTVWFAGSNGKFGRIINNKLQIDSISFEGKNLQFRSIAFNGSSIFILSIENPAILYKIKSNNISISKPEIVYKEEHLNVFYDSMTFLDEKYGIAMGDPVDDCFSVILTSDGGNTWEKLNCNNLPKLVKSEAAFAASNGNIAIVDENIWIVSGGSRSRVFHSKNRGLSWSVLESPITHGGKMTGIYCVDFYDKNNGIIMGGNWEDKLDTDKTKAITYNGGKTWQLIANNQVPGYISSVQYRPNTKGKEVFAVSTEGIFSSSNKGTSWKKISDRGFYTIRFINKNTAWLSKNNQIVKMHIN